MGDTKIVIIEERITFCPLCNKTNKRNGFHIITDDYTLDLHLCEEHFAALKEAINTSAEIMEVKRYER